MVRSLASLLVLFSLVLPGRASADESRDALRAFALKLINRDRVEHNLPPLELDPALSAIADRRALEVLDNEPLDVPIYVYYSHAGTNDSVNENIHAWSVTYPLTGHALRELTRKSQKTMMQEKPPYDGRRAAILDVFATHAAIGFAWEGGEFRIVQVLVRRYVHWATSLPRCATPSTVATVAAWPLAGTAFDSITVHFEPQKQRQTRRRRRKAPETTLVNNHALPKRRREYLPKLGSGMRRHDDGKVTFFRMQYGPDRYGDVVVGPDGGFTFDVPFSEGPGVYTVVVWVRFVEMAESFPATMTAIVVEDAPASTAILPPNS